jgi:hypothetical protein
MGFPIKPLLQPAMVLKNHLPIIHDVFFNAMLGLIEQFFILLASFDTIKLELGMAAPKLLMELILDGNGRPRFVQYLFEFILDLFLRRV